MTTMRQTRIQHEQAERLAEWVKEHRGEFGSLVIEDVVPSVDADWMDEDAIYLVVKLAEPATGDTWSVDDVLDLRRAVTAESAVLDVDVPVYVRRVSALADGGAVQ